MPERRDELAPPLWRHLLAVLLLPGTVTVLVPVWILDSADLGSAPLVGLGALSIACGAALWAWTVSLFARIGRGTLAPWDQTRRLVVAGPYRHVRNPMITGVLLVLAGEAALFASLGVLIWAAAFFLLNCVWFVLGEEPGLRRRFGEEYEEYARTTPRWVPHP